MAARPPARGRRRHDYSGHRSGAAGAPSVTPPPLAPTSGGRSRRRAMASISPQALSSHVAGEPPPEIHDRDCRAERVAQRDEGPSVVPGRRRPGVIRPAPLREWFPSHATPAPKFGGIAAASSSARTRCRSFNGGRARLGGACPALAEPRRRSGRSAAPGTGAVRSSRLRRPGRSAGAPVRFAMVGAWAWSSWIRVVRPPPSARAGPPRTSASAPPKEASQPPAPFPSGSAGSGRERAPHAPAVGVPAARHGSVAGATGVGPGAADSAGRARRHRPAHLKTLYRLSDRGRRAVRVLSIGHRPAHDE
jgi:hypothetical protein